MLATNLQSIPLCISVRFFVMPVWIPHTNCRVELAHFASEKLQFSVYEVCMDLKEEDLEFRPACSEPRTSLTSVINSVVM